MENHLAPTYQQSFADVSVLWYSKSNSYSVVDEQFKKTLDIYFAANSHEEFAAFFSDVNDSDFETIVTTIKDYLINCNSDTEVLDTTPRVFNRASRNFSHSYLYNNKVFEVHYGSDIIKKLFHPSLEYLQIRSEKPAEVIFDIYLEDDYLLLFKNEDFVCKFPKQEYHKVQGKFITEVLNFIHDKSEEDWIGTFHGSAVTDENSSILFIGESGKGKSTLCSILATNGMYLLADDVSPLSAKTLNLHSNPAAVSIKKGAFETLESQIESFESIIPIYLNKVKGVLKYVPLKKPQKSNYPCKQIISVNYEKGAETKLESISVSKALGIMIPDSWLSPIPEHADLFLKWLKSLEFYELTYSDKNSAISEIKVLFEKNKLHG